MDDPTALPPDAEVLAIRILLVEDELVDRMKIRRIVQHDHRFALVGEVSTVKEAIDLLEAGAVADVMLLDLNLADSSGVDTVARVQQLFPGLPIVVLTGLADDDYFGRAAIASGAQDYLCKGEISQTSLARSVSFALERMRRMQNEAKVRDLQHELKLITSMRNLARAPEFPPMPGFEMASYSHPVTVGGGDLYDFVPFRDGSVGIIVADVAGHDFVATQIMLTLRYVAHAVAPLLVDLQEFCEILNQMVEKLSCSDPNHTKFATCFVAKVDPRTREFTYVGAGHDAYLFDREGRATHLDSNGAPLGLGLPTRFLATSPRVLAPGQTLAILTDGFAEAPSNGPWQFSSRRVVEAIGQAIALPPAQIFHHLIHQVNLFLGNRAPNDDMTGIILKSV